MTDIEPALLIQSEGQVTGTDAHRWADQRTSHSSTISICYLLSTHYSVNTNYFSPENLERLTGFDNLNLSFQAIFSYFSLDNNEVVTFGHIPPSHEFWTVKCPHCLQGINEEMMDMSEESLMSAQRFIESLPRNEYTFIPFNKFFPKQETIVKRSCIPSEEITRFPVILNSSVLHNNGTSVGSHPCMLLY